MAGGMTCSGSTSIRDQGESIRAAARLARFDAHSGLRPPFHAATNLFTIRSMNPEIESVYDAPVAAGGGSHHDHPADWVRHRLIGLTKLMEITRRLSAQTELEPILEIITEGACQALECERACLFLYDEKRRELYTRVA